MKFAIDTNLIVSATFKLDSPPALVLAAWRTGHIEWVTCTEQLAELEIALRRPKVLTRVVGGEAFAKRLVDEIYRTCTLKTLTYPLPPVCRDARDDFLFALASQHGVDMIISGDKDVLEQKEIYPVLTARELIDRL